MGVLYFYLCLRVIFLQDRYVIPLIFSLLSYSFIYQHVPLFAIFLFTCAVFYAFACVFTLLGEDVFAGIEPACSLDSCFVIFVVYPITSTLFYLLATSLQTTKYSMQLTYRTSRKKRFLMKNIRVRLLIM